MVAFLFYCNAVHRHLHSFPTRRSSDLPDRRSVGRCGADEPLVLRRDGAPESHVRVDLRHHEDDRFDVGAGELERSEEHTSELQSHVNLVCRLLLEKKKMIVVLLIITYI